MSIENHIWFDNEVVESAEVDCDGDIQINLLLNEDVFYIGKQDAIAIASHFKLDSMGEVKK